MTYRIRGAQLDSTDTNFLRYIFRERLINAGAFCANALKGEWSLLQCVRAGEAGDGTKENLEQVVGISSQVSWDFLLSREFYRWANYPNIAPILPCDNSQCDRVTIFIFNLTELVGTEVNERIRQGIELTLTAVGISFFVSCFVVRWSLHIFCLYSRISQHVHFLQTCRNWRIYADELRN